jgi:hypothetical protein
MVFLSILFFAALLFLSFIKVLLVGSSFDAMVARGDGLEAYRILEGWRENDF